MQIVYYVFVPNNNQITNCSTKRKYVYTYRLKIHIIIIYIYGIAVNGKICTQICTYLSILEMDIAKVLLTGCKTTIIQSIIKTENNPR
jgi:hypothetical protein